MGDDLEESNKKSTAKETVHFPRKKWKIGGLKSSEILELSKEDEKVALEKIFLLRMIDWKRKNF